MTKHEWRDRTEDGEIVYYRANHHAGRWEFYSTLKSDPDWTKREILPLEVMESLREVLWNKHQRRRLPLKHVEQIDKMIEEMREAAADEESRENG
ncbi:MAG: hypothetical protein WD342_17015 [Verrucomicrobiales bacterium]